MEKLPSVYNGQFIFNLDRNLAVTQNMYLNYGKTERIIALRIPFFL